VFNLSGRPDRRQMARLPASELAAATASATVALVTASADRQNEKDVCPARGQPSSINQLASRPIIKLSLEASKFT